MCTWLLHLLTPKECSYGGGRLEELGSWEAMGLAPQPVQAFQHQLSMNLLLPLLNRLHWHPSHSLITNRTLLGMLSIMQWCSFVSQHQRVIWDLVRNLFYILFCTYELKNCSSHGPDSFIEHKHTKFCIVSLLMCLSVNRGSRTKPIRSRNLRADFLCITPLIIPTLRSLT